MDAMGREPATVRPTIRPIRASVPNAPQNRPPRKSSLTIGTLHRPLRLLRAEPRVLRLLADPVYHLLPLLAPRVAVPGLLLALIGPERLPLVALGFPQRLPALAVRLPQRLPVEPVLPGHRLPVGRVPLVDLGLAARVGLLDPPGGRLHPAVPGLGPPAQPLPQRRHLRDGRVLIRLRLRPVLGGGELPLPLGVLAVDRGVTGVLRGLVLRQPLVAGLVVAPVLPIPLGVEPLPVPRLLAVEPGPLLPLLADVLLPLPLVLLLQVRPGLRVVADRLLPPVGVLLPQPLDLAPQLLLEPLQPLLAALAAGVVLAGPSAGVAARPREMALVVVIRVARPGAQRGRRPADQVQGSGRVGGHGAIFSENPLDLLHTECI